MNEICKKNVIESLRYLADYDFQKRAWLASSGPVVSSFVEDICQLFNDTGLDRAMKAGEPIFGKDADNCLRELDQLVSKVNHKLPPADLIDNPLVQAVRKKAGEALELIALNAIVK